MIKVRRWLVTWPYMDTIITATSKELSKDTLSIVELDDRGIATGFYDKT